MISINTNSISGYYVEDLTTPEHIELRDRLGEATTRWMQEICTASNEAESNYKKDKRYIQKCVWYASDLLKACKDLNQASMVKFLNDNYRLLLGYASPKYFDRIPDRSNLTGCRIMHFLAKAEVLPIEAFKAAVQGLTIADCGVTCQLARYGALLDILGEAKFNRLFGNEAGQPINIGYVVDDEKQPMRLFVDFTRSAKTCTAGQDGNRPVKKGQLILINGVAEYSLKKPLGVEKAYNAVCIDQTPGQQKFCALGLKAEGETESEINRKLIEAYNESEDPFILVTSDVMKAMFTAVCPTLLTRKDHQASRSKGYDKGSPQDFKIDLINDLIKLPLAQVSMAFVKNHPANKQQK